MASIDIDASGYLITTEFGGPPQLFPAGLPNYQAYNVQAVYPYLYAAATHVAPTDEQSYLALQQAYWTSEVAYLKANDPSLIGAGD